MPDEWYEEVDASARLMQGDLIVKCPLVRWKAELPSLSGHSPDEVLEASDEVFKADVVVMTQACDLAEEKVRNVLLCPAATLSVYKSAWEDEMRSRNQNPTDKAWRSHFADLKDGFVWNLAVLNSGRAGGSQTEHRVVDFHDMFTIPRSFLESVLRERGERRLRLLPPYREHLSQAFARFVMRVGLPTPVTALP